MTWRAAAVLSVIAIAVVGISTFLAAQDVAPRLPEPLYPARLEGTTLPEFLYCSSFGAPLISAHRGGPARGFPENSLEAIADTLSTSFALIEVDVNVSSDGRLILFHDGTLDRTTNGTGTVQHPLRMLRALHLEDAAGTATDFRIPLFADVLEWARDRAILQLDRKGDASWDTIAAAVRAADMEDRVIAIAYSLDEAVAIHTIMPGAVISAPIHDEADLRALLGAGIPRSHLVAWLGLTDIETEPLRTKFYFQLGERHGPAIELLERARIPAAAGVFLDALEPIEVERGNTQSTNALVSSGMRIFLTGQIDIYATNQPRYAFHTTTSRLPDVPEPVEHLSACLDPQYCADSDTRTCRTVWLLRENFARLPDHYDDDALERLLQ